MTLHIIVDRPAIMLDAPVYFEDGTPDGVVSFPR